ncbi:MAG: hypothetical protein Q8L48_30415 [Archangium sp.]|nr:hypothetical protein [Archangium sp.]
MRGFWTVVPADAGKLNITYLIFSDPGGAVPPFLAKGGQRKAAIDFFKTILARVKDR